MLLPMQFNAVEGEGGAPETETPEAAQEPAAPEEPAKEEPEGTAPEEKAPENKTFTQAELDEIVQKRISKLERKMERKLIEAETRAKVQQEQQAKPEPAADEPKVEDYQTYDAYLKDLAKYTVKIERAAQAEAEKQASVKQREQSETERTNERQQDLLESGEKKYDDFEDVVKSDKTEYSRAAYLAILESDQSADIVYHLAKNQDEAKRIAALPAYAQAKEIGKLEDKLASKPKPKPSNAPDPIKPLGGGSSPTVDLKNATMDEYVELRKKQGAGWAR
jgi:hypothetical protein